MASTIILQPSEDGLRYLKRLLRYGDNSQFRQMVQDGQSVQREFGRLFHPENLPRLTAEEFKEFLLYEHNRHWWGIHRHQRKLVSDMARLRDGLAVLTDEARPIETRLDWIEPANGVKPVPGLGKAVFTPILHVVYPDRYGVWNSISESAMTRLGFWPSFPWGASFGEKYVLMNGRLKIVATELEVDLWTLDSLWWLTEVQHEPTKHQFDGGTSGSSGGAGSRRSRPPATFLCMSCFQTKAANLRHADTDVCVDCTPES